MRIKVQIYRGKCFGKFRKKFPENSDIFIATWFDSGERKLEAFGSQRNLDKFFREREIVYEYNTND